MATNGIVRELRLCVTAPDYDDAVRFYRDVLGLRELLAYSSPDGRVSILDAGRATLELSDPAHAEFIDEVEVGRRVAGQVRVAFEVDDSAATTKVLAAAGATVIAEPTRTPWNSVELSERATRRARGLAAHSVHRARRLTSRGWMLERGFAADRTAATTPGRRASIPDQASTLARP